MACKVMPRAKTKYQMQATCKNCDHKWMIKFEMGNRVPSSHKAKCPYCGVEDYVRVNKPYAPKPAPPTDYPDHWPFIPFIPPFPKPKPWEKRLPRRRGPYEVDPYEFPQYPPIITWDRTNRPPRRPPYEVVLCTNLGIPSPDDPGYSSNESG